MRRIKVIKMKLAIQQTVERQLVPNLLSLSEGGNMWKCVDPDQNLYSF